MSENAEPDLYRGKGSPLVSNKWGIIGIIASLTLIAGSFYSCDNSSTNQASTSAPQSASANQSEQVNGFKIIKVMLDPVDWSDWIHLPSSTPYDLDAHGWHEYEFDLGQGRTRKIRVGGPKEVLGEVPSSSFRIRGRKQLAIVSYKLKR